MEFKPKKIKAELFPYDAVEIPELVAELHGKKLLAVYEVDGLSYLAIPTFAKHQRPHPKEPASVLPQPPCDKSTCAKAVEKHGGPCKETASCALPSSNPLILPPSTAAVSGWEEVEEELVKLPMAEHREAIADAKRNGVDAEHVLKLVEFWRANPGRWEIGALRKRIGVTQVRMEIEACWPAPPGERSPPARSSEYRRVERHVFDSHHSSGDFLTKPRVEQLPDGTKRIYGTLRSGRKLETIVGQPVPALREKG